MTRPSHAAPAAGETVFPGAQWQQREPAEAGLNPAAVEEVATMLGGRGCVVRNGYVVKAWGDQVGRSDWMSSAKPVLSTLLFFALQERLVKSVDQPIADFGWKLEPKDRKITFRHLGAMTSGYARPEGPGEAWAYNDFAIQLYQKTLFDRVFKAEPKAAAEHPKRLGALGLQDGLYFRDGTRRLGASVRDFARIGWFWLQKGRWGDRQLLPREYFDRYMRPQVPAELPKTRDAKTEDYLEVDTFGGGSDHFTDYGAGIYGFNWWFNATGRLHPKARTWPDAPADTVMTIGVGGNCSALMPGLGLLLVGAAGDWGDLAAGDPASRMNRILAMLARAAGG
jgi:CubicO group peptidase (beta-lactamase class C family)